MPSEDPGIKAVMAKRRAALSTRAAGDVTAAETTPQWRPKNDREAELHRERGRRTVAERRARASDSALVAAIAKEHFAEVGIGDPAEVLANLQAVHAEGGPGALEEVVGYLDVEFGDALADLDAHVDELRFRQAQEDAFREAQERVEHRKTLAEVDERTLTHYRETLSPPVLAHMEQIAEHMDADSHPHAADDPDERLSRWQALVGLSKQAADHEAIIARKRAMFSSPRIGMMFGEDDSLPRSVSRQRTLDALYGENALETWEPDVDDAVDELPSTPDEIKNLHDWRRYELREHLDHPSGVPDGHVLSEHDSRGNPKPVYEAEDEWGRTG